jgi:hypothetical protein
VCVKNFGKAMANRPSELAEGHLGQQQPKEKRKVPETATLPRARGTLRTAGEYHDIFGRPE